MHGQDFSQRTSNAEQFLDKTKAVEAQVAWQSRHHRQKVAGDIHWMIGITHARFVPVAARHAQLPDGVFGPLLVDLHLGELRLLRIEIWRKHLWELLFQEPQILVAFLRLIPQGNEGIIKRAKQVDLLDESVKLVQLKVRGIIVRRGELDASLQSKRPASLQGICSTAVELASVQQNSGVVLYIPFRNEEKPIESPAPRRFNLVILVLVCPLLVHVHHMHQCGCLAQMKPCLVVQIETIVAAEEKVARAERVEAWRIHVVEALPHPDGLLQEQGAGDDVCAWHALKTVWIAARH